MTAGSRSSGRAGWLVRVELAWACFGLEVDQHGTVSRAAPIAAWTQGRPASQVVASYRHRGARVTWTPIPNALEEVTPLA